MSRLTYPVLLTDPDDFPAWQFERERRRSAVRRALARTTAFVERVRRSKHAALTDLASVKAEILEHEQIVAQFLTAGDDASALRVGEQLRILERTEAGLGQRIQRLDALQSRLARLHALRLQREASYILLERHQRRSVPAGKALA